MAQATTTPIPISEAIAKYLDRLADFGEFHQAVVELAGNADWLPADWTTTIDTFLEQGLTAADLTRLVAVTLLAPLERPFVYFCRCCWNTIRAIPDPDVDIAVLWRTWARQIVDLNGESS